MNLDILAITILQQFSNPIFDAISSALDLLFEYLIILLFTFIIYLWKKKNFFVVFLASLTTFATSFFIKEIIARPRPTVEVHGLITSINSFSFPSAHTAIAFTLAVLLSKYYPKYKIIFYVLAIITAITRIYSGAHYLSDVIGGAILGIAIGYVFLIKEKKILGLEAKIHKQLKSIFKI